MNLQNVKTPCLLLNKSKLERNLARMADRARQFGVELRPHLKTAKSVDVARLALKDRTHRVTVSTLAEARYFIDHGIRDLTYAVGITPAKMPEVMGLMANGAEISLVTDNGWAVGEVACLAAEQGVECPVMIEIDCGGGRGGVDARSDALIELGRRIDAASGVKLAGVLSHAGQSYLCKSVAEIETVAEAERRATVDAAARLADAGFSCPVVSIGSTPTACFARSLDGVTEIRPGVYMFMDLTQTMLGVCQESDIAVSVLATVIGHRRELNRILTDAGALAMSQDGSLPGFGKMAGGSGLVVGAVYQEHGVLEPATTNDFDALPIGSHVEILPNHACMTAAMYDHYVVVNDAGLQVDQWHRCRGW